MISKSRLVEGLRFYQFDTQAAELEQTTSVTTERRRRASARARVAPNLGGRP